MKRFSVIGVLLLALLPSVVYAQYSPVVRRGIVAAHWAGDFTGTQSWTANTTTASPTVSNFSPALNSTNAPAVGQYLSGGNIPTTATVSSVNIAGNSVTMSANATTGVTGATITGFGKFKNIVNPGTRDAFMVGASGFSAASALNTTNGSSSTMQYVSVNTGGDALTWSNLTTTSGSTTVGGFSPAFNASTGSFTCTTTSGSATVSNFSPALNGTNLVVGQVVNASTIPTNAIVASINTGANTATLTTTAASVTAGTSIQLWNDNRIPPIGSLLYSSGSAIPTESYITAVDTANSTVTLSTPATGTGTITSVTKAYPKAYVSCTYMQVRDRSSASLKQAIRMPGALTGSWTVIYALNELTGSGLSTYILSDATTAATFALYRQSHYQLGSTASGSAVGNLLSDPTGQFKALIIQYNANSRILRYSFDGVGWQSLTCTSDVSLTGLQLGAPTTGTLNVGGGNVSSNRNTELLYVCDAIYQSYLNDDELRREMKNIAKQLLPANLRFVYWFGNSHMVGYRANFQPRTSARAITQSWLLGTQGYPIVFADNMITGRPTKQSLGMMANNVNGSSYYQVLCPNNAVVYTEDTNEYNFATSLFSYTDAQATRITKYRSREAMTELFPVFDTITALSTLARYGGDAAGYRPAVVTDRNNHLALLESLDKGRDTYWRSIPWGEDSNLGTVSNTTYFNQDQVHLNDNGNSYSANTIWKPYIEAALYPATPGVLTVGTPGGTSITGNAWTAATAGPRSGSITTQLQYCYASQYELSGDWQDMAGATSSPASITGLGSGLYYAVRTKYTDANDTGNPTYSNYSIVATTGSPSDNSTPTISSAVASTDGRYVTFTTSKPTTGAGGFHIYQNGVEVPKIFSGRGGATTICYYMQYSLLSTSTLTYTYIAANGEGAVIDCTTNANALAAVTTPTAITNNSDVSVGSVTVFSFPSVVSQGTSLTGMDAVLNSGSSDLDHFLAQAGGQWQYGAAGQLGTYGPLDFAYIAPGSYTAPKYIPTITGKMSSQVALVYTGDTSGISWTQTMTVKATPRFQQTKRQSRGANADGRQAR